MDLPKATKSNTPAELRLLPSGWAWATVGEITQPVSTTSPADRPDVEFKYLDISSIDNRRTCITDPKTLLGRAAPSRARQIVAENDVLFSTVRTYLKNIALVPKNLDGQVASTGFSVLRARDSIEARFLFYYTLSRKFLEPLSELQRGSSYPAVREEDVRVQWIPVSPQAEQRRIVSKIEELLSELDKGVENLSRAEAQLAVQSQALLKYAFSGALTSSWRIKTKSEDWTNAPLPHFLLEGPSNGRSVPDRRGGFRVLRLTALKKGGIDLSKNKEGAWTEVEAASFKLRQGDFLVSRGNGSLRLVGRGGLVPKDAEIAYPDTMMRLVIDPTLYRLPLFSILWNSEFFRRQIEASARTTAGIYKINQGAMASYRLPLIPLAEQDVLLDLLEAQLPTIEHLEADIDLNLRKSEALRQAILQKAFAGELVPQDPSDEPASVLLERIRAERAAEPPARSGRRTNVRS